MKKIFNQNNRIWLFLLPSFIGVFVLYIIPYLDVLRRSFSTGESLKGGFGQNYVEVANNYAFRLSMWNSFKFILICIPLLVVISLILATFIFENEKLGKIFRPISLLPMAIPVASIVMLWKVVFSDMGFLSSFLHNFGVKSKDWMDTGVSFYILVFSYIWKNLGYTIILWLSGLASIPKNLYEAARIDGASKLKRFFYITIPNLKSSFFVIMVISLINSFKVFREAYLIAGNYPNKKIYMVQHILNNWFEDLNISRMSAASVIVGVFLFILILLLKKAWKK